MTPTPEPSTASPPLAMPPTTRSALAALSPGLAQRVWHGHELATAPVQAMPTGYPALDAQLPGGGWPHQCVTEVLQPQDGVAEWRLLLPGLAPLLADDRPLIAIGCPHEPYLPGLRQAGVQPGCMVWVRALSLAQRLWATELAIKSAGPGAVLAWLPHARAAHIRRLQTHALACNVPVFLLRPGSAQHEASAAPLRVLVSPLGAWHLGLSILKRRGAAHEGVIRLRSIPSRLATVIPARRPHALVPPQPDTQRSGDAALVDALLAGTPHDTDVGFGR